MENKPQLFFSFLSFPLFDMFTDEREDTLREVAALGNIKAVLHFAHSGVNVNSQNKMNGWCVNAVVCTCCNKVNSIFAS